MSAHWGPGIASLPLVCVRCEMRPVNGKCMRIGNPCAEMGGKAISAPNPPEKPDGSPRCCWCAGPHDWSACPVVYTPIIDCEHKDAVDGCCSHPKNMTPECHVNACPRLHRLLWQAGNAAAS